jgi:integrase
MASHDFDVKTQRARLFFRYGGRQFNRTIKVQDHREASRACALIEETIQDLERGKLTMSDDADVAAFIVSGGKLTAKPALASPQAVASAGPTEPHSETASLKSLFAAYTETLTPGTKEASTLYTETIHTNHLVRVLGEDQEPGGLDLGVVQDYVDARAREGVQRGTIRKELVTLRMIWSWAAKRGHVTASLKWKISDLTFPKAPDRPPFRTWEQITRRIARGGLSAAQVSDLWECLWLNQTQTVECLAWVKERAAQPVAHVAFAFAAYTGARRSEMIRSERDDWDFEADVVTIRQKKVDHSKNITTRLVPIHPALATVMGQWFDRYPAAHRTLITEDGAPLNADRATRLFRTTLRGGKWSVLRGWHTFRHSLASNLASAGTDQRIINEILGHHTEEMERRYRHLLPQKQHHALCSLFPHAVGA